ncbi:MAG: ABC transporter permease [Bdellovibrionales bacterium]|nr:ABC transporter permease [Bdellovibrionales bacterium]
MSLSNSKFAPAPPAAELSFRPFLSLLKKEIKRFLKVSIQTVLTPIVSSSLYLLIFGVSLGAFIKVAEGVTYLEFLIPGLVMMGCLNNAFQNASSSVIVAKFAGDLEDLKVSPISYFQIISAIALGGLFRGVLVGFITFLVGSLFTYFSIGHVLGVAHPLWLFYFLTVGGLAFSLLGLATAFWAKSFDHMSAVNSFILLPLIYLGGVFFSIHTLHPFWQSLARLNPLLYFINGVRHGLLGVSDVNPLVAAAIAFLTLCILYVIAFATLKRSSFVRW